MRSTGYHLGGHKPGTPAQNRAEELDSDAGTYTRWDESGKVVEQRPLAPEEVARFAAGAAAHAAAEQAETNGRTLEQRLRTLLARNGEFLALTAPTVAERNAQTARLTRECSALIRYVLRDLDDISGTE